MKAALIHYKRLFLSPLLGLILFTGCASREWYLGGEPKPRTQYGDTVVVEFKRIRETENSVSITLLIENASSDKMIRFKPRGVDSRYWGISLVPQLEGVAAAGSRHDRRYRKMSESFLDIAPRKSLLIKKHWKISPSQSGCEWAWNLRIDGLVEGTKELETIHVTPPKYMRVPDPNPAQGKFN